MATVEQAREGQINPEQLQAAVDYLLKTKGTRHPDGTLSIEFFPPGEVRADIRDRSFNAVTRYKDSYGSLAYIWEEVTPPNIGVSRKHLFFKNDSVSCRRETELLGKIEQDENQEGFTLLPEEISELYKRVIDPRVEPRQQAISRHDEQRRAQQSWFGRLLAKF